MTFPLIYEEPKFFPKGGPQTLADFFDVKKYPGPRGIEGYSAYGVLEAALVADGVTKEQLYRLDRARAYRKLDQLKPHVSLWYTSGAQQTQALIDGEVYVGYFWIDRALAAIDGGVDLVVPFQDGDMSVEYLAIPKTCRDPEAVYRLLNFALGPKQEAIFTEVMKYGPVNPATIQYLSKSLQSNINSSPKNIKVHHWLNAEYWSPRFKENNQEYEKWLQKN